MDFVKYSMIAGADKNLSVIVEVMSSLTRKKKDTVVMKTLIHPDENILILVRIEFFFRREMVFELNNYLSS